MLLNVYSHINRKSVDPLQDRQWLFGLSVVCIETYRILTDCQGQRFFFVCGQKGPQLDVPIGPDFDFTGSGKLCPKVMAFAKPMEGLSPTVSLDCTLFRSSPSDVDGSKTSSECCISGGLSSRGGSALRCLIEIASAKAS